MQALTPITPLEPGVEMFQKGKLQPFLAASRATAARTTAARTTAARTTAARPLSEATEILDTDFEDQTSHSAESESEFEEDSSPRGSFNSFSQRSQTTISTYDEVVTPRSNRSQFFDFQIGQAKPVEGPRGPHLFRASQSSAEFNYDYALQLSPVLPKQEPPSRAETAFRTPATAVNAVTFQSFQPVVDSAPIDKAEVRTWTSHQVAVWMSELGFEESIIESFELHDITGAVLLDLQFEDLKELDIRSFGKRHRLWNEIELLRADSDVEGNPPGPSETPFEDISRPCTAARQRSRNGRSKSRARHRDVDVDVDDAGGCTPVTRSCSRKRRGRKQRRQGDEAITPAESVSIVAIEQLLPKPHKCAKGEQCSKWRKQQKQLAKLRDEHGFPISPEKGGHIFVAGDPGNAGSAAKVVDNVVLRPHSDVVPSVVASSDVLGPGELPGFATLQEDALRGVEHRDPQENVKNFLNLQHLNLNPTPPFEEEAPPTPPLELFPPLHNQPYISTPHSNLKTLPKLCIPRSASVQPQSHAGHLFPPNPVPADPNSAITSLSPCRSAAASPAAGTSLYRFGTPASEMDVPVTAVPAGPIARDASQSVPPNMQYRDPISRSGSRNAEWRRPSFALPALAEGEVFSPSKVVDEDGRPQTALKRSNTGISMKSCRSGPAPTVAAQNQQQFSQVPPPELARGTSASTTVGKYPAPMSVKTEKKQYPNVQHSGWMKKRRTRLLRHEWHESHFRLAGTRLAMHKDDEPSSAPLQTIDVDDYSVACGSVQSGIKLGARLKALKISSGAGGAAASGISDKDLASISKDWLDGKPGSKDPAAFTFQLVPQAHAGIAIDGLGAESGSGGNVLRKGGPPGAAGMAAANSAASAGAHKKTHHFAVRNRDERIDWMRELMVAKALKAKGEGFEVTVNGNAV